MPNHYYDPIINHILHRRLIFQIKSRNEEMGGMIIKTSTDNGLPPSVSKQNTQPAVDKTNASVIANKNAIWWLEESREHSGDGNVDFLHPRIWNSGYRYIHTWTTSVTNIAVIWQCWFRNTVSWAIMTTANLTNCWLTAIPYLTSFFVPIILIAILCRPSCVVFGNIKYYDPVLFLKWSYFHILEKVYFKSGRKDMPHRNVFATNIAYKHDRIWRIVTGHKKNIKRTLTNNRVWQSHRSQITITGTTLV